MKSTIIVLIKISTVPSKKKLPDSIGGIESVSNLEKITFVANMPNFQVVKVCLQVS